MEDSEKSGQDTEKKKVSSSRYVFSLNNLLTTVCLMLVAYIVSTILWYFPPRFKLGPAMAISVLLAVALVLFIPKFQLRNVEFEKKAERFRAENEARKTVATLIGGVAIFLSFYTAQQQLGVQQQAQFTDRYTNAIEEIAATDASGKPKLAVRIGGLYVLEQIMNASEAQHASILEVLCAYVRENSLQSILRPPDSARADTRVALTILGRRSRELETSVATNKERHILWRIIKTIVLEHKMPQIFTAENLPQRLDLTGSNLENANLNHLDLSGADLTRANLANCVAIFAQLREVDFGDADLSGCVIASTLEGAEFANAKLVATTISGKISASALERADIGFSLLINADIENPMELKKAKNWKLAFFNPKDLAILGLPPDHNERIFARIPSRKLSDALKARLKIGAALHPFQKVLQELHELPNELDAKPTSD